MKVECSKCHEWVEMNERRQKCSACGWDLLKDYQDEMVPKDAPDNKPKTPPSDNKPKTPPSETESTTYSYKDTKEKLSSTTGESHANESHISCMGIIIIIIVTFIIAFLVGTLLVMRDAANNAPYLQHMK
ncbi:MAG: hypothetical protein J6A01_07590 [Proteobacteria bacterium]|nr:hypothetical protein [Pseudomonadota bacterium]